jgi:hypothetical protein
VPLEACARCASQDLQPLGLEERRCRACGHEGAPERFRYFSQWRAFQRTKA